MSLATSSDPALTAAIFDAAVDGILVIDGRGIIVAVNAAAQDAFGYASVELIGNNVSMLMPAPDAGAHDGYIQAYERTDQARIIGVGREVIARRKDGHCFPIYLSIGQYTEDGERRYVGICHDASQRRRDTERIAYLAQHDSLTGVINRNQFMHLLGERLDEARAQGTGLAALFLDLDGFKQVNDRHGHDVGDSLLREIAGRLRDALHEGQSIGRMGGDEFAVLLPGLSDPVAARTMAQRLRAAVTPPVSVAGLTLGIEASTGIALFPEHGQNADELMSGADMAMYHAKQSGGGVCLFEPSMREHKAARYRMLEKLRAALDRGEFTLHYQPQFDLDTLAPCGVEALLRWQSPREGMIAPSQFIPLAMESGLMPRISRWVLRQACADNAALIALGLLDAPVAVNLCLPTLLEDGFVEFLTAVLREAGLPGERLEIEITEDVAMVDSPVTLRHAQCVRAMGVKLSIDDFGVGFSSLGRLKSLYFDKIKIDRSFVAALPHDHSDRAIVRSICGIGDGLGIRVLAEGVETEAQRACLREQGCRLGQGFWYARPMPFAELLEFLRRRAPAGVPATP